MIYSSDPKDPVDVTVLNRNGTDLYPVDDYISLTWTEQYRGIGTFQLIVPRRDAYLRRFRVGRFVQHSKSRHTMVIDTISREKDIIKIVGKDLVYVLTRRIMANLEPGGSHLFKYPPAQVAVEAVRAYTSKRGAYLINKTDGLDLTAGNAVMSGESIYYRIEDRVAMDVVDELAGVGNFGYRMELVGASTEDDPKFHFLVYTGKDKRNIVFDSDLDTLANVSSAQSIANMYTVAYVRHERGLAAVSAYEFNHFNDSFIAPSLTRSVMFVDASSVKREDFETAEDYEVAVKTEGLLGLLDARYNNVVEGDIVTSDTLVYGRTFYLGDIISLRDTDEYQDMMVSGYTWNIEGGVVKQYPSFNTLF